MAELSISVILPVWNRQATIGRAIASIRGSYRGPIELIVVDDGSTDDTGSAAESSDCGLGIPNSRVIRQPNAGPGAARNFGAAHATGEYLAFLDSDDYWFPWTLSFCVDALTTVPHPALMFLQTIDIPRSTPPTHPPSAPPKLRSFAGFLEAVAAEDNIRFASCNAIMPKDVFEALGGFRSAAEPSEDTDLFLRATRMGPCLLATGAPLVAHELGLGDNLTGSFHRVHRGFQHLMAENSRGTYPMPPADLG